MKKISLYLFPLVYACFGGLLANCFTYLSAFVSPFEMHGHPLRFLIVCALLALISLSVLIPLVIANYNRLPDGTKAKRVLTAEVIESVLLFLPFLWLWSILLDRIADYFLL